MKKISAVATLALSAVLLFSCTPQGTVTTDSDSTTQTSTTSSNLDGIYRGVKDGEKITLYLMKDKTFKLVKESIKEENSKKESTGSYAIIGKLISFTDAGKIVTYLHTDDVLTQVDASGNKISTKDLDKYILTKGNYSILNKKWTLVEINGKKVTPHSDGTEDAHIQFYDAENRYSAYAGCNRMSGSFTTEGYNKLKKGAGITTLMACSDMELEGQLSKVIEQADSFIYKNNELHLVKGRMATLAKFITPAH